MKPLEFNLRSAKKISGDQQSSTFQLKNGHQIKVAHAALSKDHREKVMQMPVYKDAGGSMGEDDSSSGNTDDNSQPQAGYIANPDTVGSTLGLAPETVKPNEAGPQSIQVDAHLSPDQQQQLSGGDDQDSGAPMPASVQDQSKAPSQVAPPADGGFSDYFGQGQKAIREQQAVETQLAKANAQTEENDVQARQNNQAGFQKNYQDFQDQHQKFMQDLQNEHIDPKHYQESMGSGQKAATAIGLFLGGWGNAYTHNGNPAMDFLNKQIDRDIESQKQNMDKTKTLLSANEAFFHDNVMAENATRMQMNDIYSHQMQLNAAKLGTPAAKAKADAAMASWGIQNVNLAKQNALLATVNHALATNGGAGLDAMDLANAGKIPQAEAIKEQSSIDAQKTAIRGVQNLYSQINNEQSTSNLLNPESNRRVAAMNAELVNTVMNASASKRLTRESIEQEIKPLMINTTDTEPTRIQKQNAVLNMIQKHADPTPFMLKYAPAALPQYNAVPQNSMEGKVAVNGAGQRIVNRGGQWVPVGR